MDYKIPAQISLCGEMLDLSKPSIRERFEYEFLRVVAHPAQVALWQRRSHRYFPLIEKSLQIAGLPDDLKYLAVGESDLRPWVASPSGALGLWQFMPGTARQFGLTVNTAVDMRQLPEPLLTAGTTYLKTLHKKFGSWALAMAAYNCGDGRLARAISVQGTSDYYQLDLPRETERYVYRIAAIKTVMENAGRYGHTLPIPRGHYQPPRFSRKVVAFAAPTSWVEASQTLGCEYKELRLLNPHLLAGLLTGSCELRLPEDS